MSNSTTQTTILITGANRDKSPGRVGLTQHYLQLPNSTVIAAVRDPSRSTSEALLDWPKADSTNLIIVKLDSASTTDASAAVTELKTKHNVEAFDIVIANAGIARGFPKVEEASVKELFEHVQINAGGPLLLFQATLPLLKKARGTPKFIAISSAAGTVGGQHLIPVPNGVYGPSKAALNWITMKIHLENEDIVAFPIHPGFVQTEMGNEAAVSFGMAAAPDTIESSVGGLVNIISKATRESHSGKFANFDDTILPW